MAHHHHHHRHHAPEPTDQTAEANARGAAPEGDHAALATVRHMLARSHADPKAIAAIIEAHPAAANQIFALLHRTHGNRFVSQVSAQLSGGAGAAKRTKGHGAAAPAAATRHLSCEVTDVQAREDGVQLVIGAGALDGVDESWNVHLVGAKLRWKIVEVRPNATIVVCSRAMLDDVLGLHEVRIDGVPRAEEQPVQAPHDDDELWKTLED